MKNKLRESFATILVYGIKSDNVISDKEREYFCSLMEQKCDASRESSIDFLNRTHPTEEDIEKHIDKIDEFLKENPMEKMHVLECLNHIIYVDGVEKNEYAIFEKLKHKFFPKVV